MKRSLYRLFWWTDALERWLALRLTSSGFVVLSCIIIAAIVGGDTNESLTYQLVAFLIALLVLAIASSRFFWGRFTATRQLPRFGTVGVPLRYRVVLHNLTRRPQTDLKLFETFADPRPSWQTWLTTPEPLEQKRTRFDQRIGYYRWRWLMMRQQRATIKAAEVPPLPAQRSVEVMVELTPIYRGVVRLRGLTLAHPDPFGLFHACVKLPLPQSILILPALYQLPPIALPGLRRYQSGGVSLASSVGESEEFRALREYRPGDPPRKIHWKSWAKLGKPIVKEEQDEFFVRHALILDTFQTEPYSDRLEAAISVAASLACDVQTQESLLDLMFVGTEAYCFTVGRGLGYTDKMLEILASVGACRDRTFEYLLPVVMNRVSLLSGCICVFLAWDDARQQLVQQLRAMQIPTLVLVIAEAGETVPGLTALDDALTHVHVLHLGQIQEGLMRL